MSSVICDVVVVGAGLAGLTAALAAAADSEVLLVSDGSLLDSVSCRAQAGIAAAVAAADSPALHVADTLRAGAGLCRESAVRVLCEEAPDRVEDLRRLGVSFDPGLGLEGGHSQRRVLHAGGAATGAHLVRALVARVRAHPRIAVAEHEPLGALWCSEGRCVGVVTSERAVAARATVLATGGMAALWQRSTNPPGAVGAAINLAYEAGAAIADLEFMQFHPTTLADSDLLLSEALRGEGAQLVDPAGVPCADALATRDVLARSIAAQGRALLDLRKIDNEMFPTLMDALREHGYDPAQDPVPVTPAAHYTIGGIVTDLQGRTSVPGLYAAGECACTGVHGANRLASNSLLECLVFGRRAGLAASQEAEVAAPRSAARSHSSQPRVSVSLRRSFWRDAGLVRDGVGLGRLGRHPHRLAQLVSVAGLLRRESRGTHFRADHPQRDPALAGHIVHRKGCRPRLEWWE